MPQPLGGVTVDELIAGIRSDVREAIEKHFGVISAHGELLLQQILQEQAQFSTQLGALSRAVGAPGTCPFKGDLMPAEANGTLDKELNQSFENKMNEIFKVKRSGSSGSTALSTLEETVETADAFKLDKKTRLQKVVRSHTFELVCTSVILLNTMYIGVATNEDIIYAIDNVGSGDSGLSTTFRQVIELCFLSSYTIEFTLRFASDRLSIFSGAGGIWKFFDFVLVIIGWVGLAAVGPGSSLMWLRMFKAINSLLRTLRVLRVVHVFREIRVLIVSVAHSLRSLVWVVLAQVMLMYMFGLLLVNGISTYLLNTESDLVSGSIRHDAERYWGTLPRAILTLYESITGGGPWRQVTLPLKEAGFVHYCLFLLYIALLVLVVLRLFTGVLVQHAKDALQSDHQANVAQNLKNWFKGLDADGSGTLTRHEFEEHMKDEDAGSVFSMLKIDRKDASKLFTLLDMSGDGTIDIREFTSGIMRLNGWAKNVDMLLLLQRVNEVENRIMGALEFVLRG